MTPPMTSARITCAAIALVAAAPITACMEIYGRKLSPLCPQAVQAG